MHNKNTRLVSCNHSICLLCYDNRLSFLYTLHRADGGRGVGVVGGCEDTRGKDISSENEQHS